MTQDRSALSLERAKSLEAALRSGALRPDRLPGLMATFKQLPSDFSEECKSICYTQPKTRLLDVGSGPFESYSKVETGGVMAVLWAERWKRSIYCVFDPSLAQSFIEVACGGENARVSVPTVKPYRLTEIRILDVLCKRLARALTNAFSLSLDVKFEVSAVSEKIEAELLCSPKTPVVAARLMADWAGQSGMFSLLIPQAALEPLRSVLSGSPARDAPLEEGDPVWSRGLAEEITRAFVGLSAVLEERAASVSEVSNFLTFGQLQLHCRSISEVRLDIEEKPAFWCELGKSGSDLSLRLVKELEAGERVGLEF